MFGKKRLLLSALIMSLIIGVAAAEETSIENLHKYKLKNGLELFVAENHTVPLAYIEIAVRGGGIAQKKENAGLFHLYEHMMFKGNSKYKNNEEMQVALTALGVSDWNGTTGTEYVNYFFTVPSGKLKEGLEFWNAAIRTPKMNKREFEAEKKVVLSEIEGDANDPGKKTSKFISEKMFPQEPWVRSPGGTSEVVTTATVNQLKAIQKEFYIPNNAALFVGGDVNPEEVFNLVNKIYGNWKKGNDPWVNNVKQYTKEPLSETEYYVVPFDQISSQFAQVEVIYRGPDAEFDRADTYAADMFLIAVRDPESYFNQVLVNNPNFAIPDSNYTWFSYLTSRRLGLIDVGAVMLAPEQFLPERAKDFVDEIPSAVAGVLDSDSVLIDEAIENVHQQLYNSTVYEQETAQSILTTARFWWCCADTDYYLSYTDSVKNTGAEQVNAFLEKYIHGKKPMVVVYINPEVYEMCKEDFEANGYEVIK